MSKIITLIKTSPDLSADAFPDYWRGRFLADLMEVPVVRDRVVRVIHNHVRPTSIREDEAVAPAEWAGVGETWFTDDEAAAAFLADADVQAVIQSHAANLPLVVNILVREVLMWDRGGEHKALKAMAFFHPNPKMSREEAQRYWNNEHVAEGARLGLGQKLSKYVQNHVVAGFHTADARYDYAGGPELWFNDIEDANSLFTDEDKVAELALDEEKFSDRASSAMMVLEEVIVYDRNQAREAARTGD